MTAFCDFAEGQPSLRRKVDAFGTVVTQVESRVVPLWIREDELSGELSAAIQCDAVVREHTRRCEESFVSEELRTSRSIGGEEACRKSSKSLLVSAR